MNGFITIYGLWFQSQKFPGKNKIQIPKYVPRKINPSKANPYETNSYGQISGKLIQKKNSELIWVATHEIRMDEENSNSEIWMNFPGFANKS